MSKPNSNNQLSNLVSNNNGQIKLINNSAAFSNSNNNLMIKSANSNEKLFRMLESTGKEIGQLLTSSGTQSESSPHSSTSSSTNTTSTTSSASASFSSELNEKENIIADKIIAGFNINNNNNNNSKICSSAPLRQSNLKSIPQTGQNLTNTKYGELIVLGYNGCITSHDNQSSRRRSKFMFKARERANGVKPNSQHNCQSATEVNNLIGKSEVHSVSYTLSRNHTVVVQYANDEKTDMFQIGRSSEPAIDFVVLDNQTSNLLTQTNNSNKLASANFSGNYINSNNHHQQQSDSLSTISRFACRILVDRNFPHTARIYAAGFDSTKRIFLGEKATKWKNEKGELDGVTTNGILIMHPSNGFTNSDTNRNEWMEVSVGGAVFPLKESRVLQSPANTDKERDKLSRTNILKDGTLIDLCGATLLWRSTEGLKRTPTKHYLDMNLHHLNQMKPQCPVGLKTLLLPSNAAPQLQFSADFLLQTNYTPASMSSLDKSIEDRIPMVYLKCGHVHGHHDWGIKKDNERECPLCRKIGPYVQLLFGLEPSFYNDVDSGEKPFKPYAFVPCGHMASETTCKYWSRVEMPLGVSKGLWSLCPFCALPLNTKQPFVKLIFQESI